MSRMGGNDLSQMSELMVTVFVNLFFWVPGAVLFLSVRENLRARRQRYQPCQERRAREWVGPGDSKARLIVLDGAAKRPRLGEGSNHQLRGRSSNRGRDRVAARR